MWIPGGTLIWLAWIFEDNPGIRYQSLSGGAVESDIEWNADMPNKFGSSWQTNRMHSIYATYLGDVHPMINEVLARNDSLTERRFLDEDWYKHGWIELYNPSDRPMSLDDYYLSDRSEDLQKWAFPDVIIEPHEYLLVWTSGKDRSEPTGELHASFNLMEREGIFLSYAASETRVDVIEDVRIPVDYSYGRYPDGSDEWYFYTQPTPGSANTAENKNRFVIDQKHVSLTVGTRHPLTVTPSDEKVIWSSDNPLVWVDPAGGLFAVQDVLREKARAVITASSLDGDVLDSCRVTIVNWEANLSELKVVAHPYASYILGTEGENLFFTIGSDLYVTSDGFETSEFLSTLPESMDIPKMLVTPFGYFIQCAKTIFKSYDLIHWTPSFTMNMRGLHHSLAYHWEPISQTGYLYAGEYSTNSDNRHRVCRGIFPAAGEESWETILEFASISEWENDPSIQNSARHVHIVAVDPYTGHVWVSTGDRDEQSKLLYSDDYGENFTLVAVGSQTWRCLSIWFTEQYVYWSMDAYSYAQSCWRIPRSRFDEKGDWPCITPELTSGKTRIGVSYLVTASETDTYFPVSVGHIYTETETRILNKRNSARTIDDPDYNYTEKVAELRNGSLWYHLWVYDDEGDPLVILGQSAEGAHRDYRGRVFGIKERPDGSVDVQELLSIGSTNPEVYDSNTMFVQLEPMAQDADGYIYFSGRRTHHRSYKTKLTWINAP
ncbi:MAG: lamin tail domain-containing protein, partial [Sedimentisphaerales bacterium]|nr:lamin tail domain-containing protein [Sedimentisphaerales bacterium]